MKNIKVQDVTKMFLAKTTLGKGSIKNGKKLTSIYKH